MEFSPLKESKEDPSCCRLCRFYYCEEISGERTRCGRLCMVMGVTLLILLVFTLVMGGLYGLGLLSELALNNFSTKDFMFHPVIALFCLFITLPMYVAIVGVSVAVFFILKWLVGCICSCCSCDECRRRYTQQYANIDA